MRIRVILAFIAIYFVWGTTYLAILFGLEGIGPFVMSALRYGLAAFVLAAWCLARKKPWPKTHLKPIIISGILMLVGGSGLVVFAEQYISSGLAAVIIATEPLWFILLDRKRWKYYFSDFRIIAGLALGFTGIILFTFAGPQHEAVTKNSYLLGAVIVLAGSVLWVVGALYAKSRLPDKGPGLSGTVVQLVAAAFCSAFLALIRGEWTQFVPQSISLQAWGGLIYLTVMGTLVAYLAFVWLIKVQPPALVSTHTLVNPIIAVLAGWLVLRESIGPLQAIALAVTMTGVFLAWSRKERSVE